MLNVGSKKSSVMCAEKNAWRNYTRNEFTGGKRKIKQNQKAEEKVIVLVIGLHLCDPKLLTVQNYGTSDLLFTAQRSWK